MKNILGIISNQGPKSYASYYEREAYDFYDEVLYIDPREVHFTLRRGEDSPEIIYHNRNLNNLSMVYVLSPPKGTWRLTILLVKCLMEIGCPISDSYEMFRREGLGKVYETLSVQENAGTSCHIVSALDSGIRLLKSLPAKDFPMVTKPVYGQHGKGIEKINTAQEGINYLQQYFKKSKHFLMLEEFITYVKEWRIYVVDGNILGSYAKSAVSGSFIANLHQGAKTTSSDSMEEIYNFIQSILPEQSKVGIYGLDVGQSSTGDIHLIETNRCPGWKGLKDTGINFPYEANKILFKRARKFNQSK